MEVISMKKKEFESYLESTLEKEVANSDFVKKELSDWHDYLDMLYKNILKSWIGEYIEKGLIKFKKNKKNIYEEFSGTYEVESLELNINGKFVIFEPIGTMLVGSKGRVDVVGKNGTVSLILVDKDSNGPNIEIKLFTSKKELIEDEAKENFSPKKNIEWAWKIFLNNNNRIEYIDLNESNFLDIITGLTNG
jgi:hypothetical protein